MKKIIFFTSLFFVLAATGCELGSNNPSDKKPVIPANEKPLVAANQNDNQAISTAAVKITPNPVKSANTNTAPFKESLPRKIDKDTAESPVYAFNSKNCERLATDDFVYQCKAYGEYVLTGGGYDGINNYTIEPKNPDAGVYIDLMPLAEGDAKKYLRNEKFVQKLGDKITWLLDDAGKPFAIFVHATFYKNIGGAKTFANPENKVAEFVFLRGLSASEEMDHDIDAVGTAYNPDEWAKKIAYEAREKSQK